MTNTGIIPGDRAWSGLIPASRRSAADVERQGSLAHACSRHTAHTRFVPIRAEAHAGRYRLHAFDDRGSSDIHRTVQANAYARIEPASQSYYALRHQSFCGVSLYADRGDTVRTQAKGVPLLGSTIGRGAGERRRRRHATEFMVLGSWDTALVGGLLFRFG